MLCLTPLLVISEIPLLVLAGSAGSVHIFHRERRFKISDLVPISSFLNLEILVAFQEAAHFTWVLLEEKKARETRVERTEFAWRLITCVGDF